MSDRPALALAIGLGSMLAGCMGDPTALCGNGTLDPGELCDPAGNGEAACPSGCNDNDSCTEDRLDGDADLCTARCVANPINVCGPEDGCCPNTVACSGAQDNDCKPPPNCGNRRIDSGETCDGDCPTTCPSNACGTYTLRGSALRCDAVCVPAVAITACANADGCCPTGCTGANDDDCEPVVTEEFYGPCSGSCEGGTCEDEVFYQGLCTKTCTSDAQCPDGGRCFNYDDSTKYCAAACSTDGDCDRTGYLCATAGTYGTSGKSCFPGATGSGRVGVACSSVTQCGGRELGDCIESWPGGYCSRRCDQSNPCPSGSTCVNLGSEEDPLPYCVDNCTGTGQGDCRSGYECFALTSVSVCVPP